MRGEVLVLALIVGFANYAFRYGPLRFGLGDGRATGPMAWFLAATGPAAIATLVMASVLPMAGRDLVPLLAGVAAVLAVWAWRRSVVLATLAGSVVYGAVFALV